MDELVNKGGEKEGDIKQLGDWWLIHTSSATIEDEDKEKRSCCASASATLEFSHSAKAVGEASSLTFSPKGLSLSTNTPLVMSVKIGPGPNISYDNTKGSLVTNAAYVSALTRLTLNSAEQRAALSEAKAVVAAIESRSVNLEQGGVDAKVAQEIRR